MIWTAGKCMYKLESVLADGGELIIYAPHISDVCIAHSETIEKVGYHCRDYFLKQWDQFKDMPWGALAHCVHVKGLGTYENGVETPRAEVTLATQIPEAKCRQINLGYRDPVRRLIQRILPTARTKASCSSPTPANACSVWPTHPLGIALGLFVMSFTDSQARPPSSAKRKTEGRASESGFAARGIPPGRCSTNIVRRRSRGRHFALGLRECRSRRGVARLIGGCSPARRAGATRPRPRPRPLTAPPPGEPGRRSR